MCVPNRERSLSYENPSWIEIIKILIFYLYYVLCLILNKIGMLWHILVKLITNMKAYRRSPASCDADTCGQAETRTYKQTYREASNNLKQWRSPEIMMYSPHHTRAATIGYYKRIGTYGFQSPAMQMYLAVQDSVDLLNDCILAPGQW